ncbi:hypothetical protein Rsub_03401 [Raphidocelis subcapitata]|uniref:Pep3/Vps18 beta-propeller domain-containing protein n=1 Tax=Raphidocelis subcapitata TaxID=307507 RepID=A0A2V0NZZ9_9CHLO|nr:hypothetical protein Rsub_03401 [Raphidocelis subcapitata]|eukprot:GBF90405.1 hypothetical protein Rsub_03401 [Raphidocelis subcapitata]
MDLLEDFDRARSTLDELGQISARTDPSAALGGGGGDGGAPDAFGFDAAAGGGGGGDGGGGGGGEGYEPPRLGLELTVRQAARGRGQIVAAAAAQDTVLLATSRGFLLRYHWDDHGNEKAVECELHRSPDLSVAGLWLDPSGRHTLAVLKNARTGAHETHYMHSTWPRPRALPRLAGLAVSAVGWQRGAAAAAAAGGGGGEGGEELDLENTTGEVLLGTETGSLHAARIDARAPAKKDAPPSPLHDWSDRRRAVCAAAVEALPCGARVALVATPGALFVASGPGPGLESAFARFQGGGVGGGGGGGAGEGRVWEPLLEVAVPSLRSCLWLGARGGGGLPARFAWMVGGCICHGHLLLERFADDASVAAGDPQEYVGDMRQLLLGGGTAAPPDGGGGGGTGAPPDGGEGGGTTPEDEPMAMAVTEYHYLLLHPDKLTAVNQVSGRTVAEVPLGGATGAPLALLQDGCGPAGGGAPLLVAGDALYEAALENEGRGMWRTYLEAEDYESALRLAAGPAQRDAVYCAMARASFGAGQYRAAAAQWGRVVGGRPPFEEVALRLVGAGDPHALATFLETRLQALSRSDRAQSTLAAAWLTELLCDRVNAAALEAGGDEGRPAYAAAVEALRSFLTRHVDSLDVGTTTSLLASYGRLEELQHYAAARGDDEGHLEHLLGRHDGAARALAVLRKPSVGAELVYRFAPPVMAQAPDDAVDFFISRGASLEPRRLLPALARFGEPPPPAVPAVSGGASAVSAAAAGRAAALRYVRFAIEALRCDDGTVHNLAAALLSLSPDEGPLLDYLSRWGRDALGRPLYDPKYALRLARDRDRPRACVKLLSQLGLHADAVALALDAVDLQLAKAVAETGPAEDDDQLRRKLWLEIARRVVQGGLGGGGGGGGGGGEAANKGRKADGAAAAAAAAAGRPGESAAAAAASAAAAAASGQAERIDQAMALLQEAGGLLRIEDVLPLFPDFVTIDAFKPAIVESLQRYSAQIEELKRDMDEATAIAEAVRTDLKLLSGRAATVGGREPCARCGRALLDAPPNAGGLPAGGAVPQFYVYPTGLAFHVLCAAEEVLQFGGPARARRTRQLLSRLARADPAAAAAAPPERPGTPPQQPPPPAAGEGGAGAGGGGGGADGSAAAAGGKDAAAGGGGGGGKDGGGGGGAAVIASLVAQLEEEVGCEDPWNGDLTVRLLDAPFTDPSSAKDAAEIEAWRV